MCCVARYNEYNVKPAFPFGHGLSYTSFEYSHLNVSTATATRTVTVSATIRNIGKVAGREVAQLYVSFPSSAQTPRQQLKSFIKTDTVAPGESVQVDLSIQPRELRVWDEVAHGWKDVVGEFHLAVGASSADLRLKGKFQL